MARLKILRILWLKQNSLSSIPVNKYAVILDDFGLGPMLDKLMEGFIRPLSQDEWTN